MIRHPQNKQFVKWCLEKTAAILSRHFPTSSIYIVRAARFHLNTFACYENFTTCNDIGVPTFDSTCNSLLHLQLLLRNCKSQMNITEDNERLILVGFSKGCVVLNQILYAFHTARKEDNDDLRPFISRISDIYWLDGGHSGQDDTWVIDPEILRSYAKLNIATHIHVTPYQVQCPTRPWIAKEEKLFHKKLQELNVNIDRRLHFVNSDRTLQTHFNILQKFMDTQ